MPDVVVHAFTDGRDTSPKGGAKFLADVEALDGARVGSVIGRYFAMDRDGRWDRIQKAYDLLVHGKGEHHADSAEQAAKDAYERDETDEFIAATTVGEEARIRPGDAVLGFNFRPDRMREITRALAEDGLRRDRARRAASWSSATRRSPSTTRTGTTRSCSRPSGPRSRSRR